MSINIPTVKCGSENIPHNTQRWQFCTNRHTTTNGNAWGWIENSPGHICRSNDGGSKITSKQARDAIDEHNRWLDDQRPTIVKLIDALEKRDVAAARVNKAKSELEHLNAFLIDAQNEVDQLEKIYTHQSNIE